MPIEEILKTMDTELLYKSLTLTQEAKQAHIYVIDSYQGIDPKMKLLMDYYRQGISTEEFIERITDTISRYSREIELIKEELEHRNE